VTPGSGDDIGRQRQVDSLHQKALVIDLGLQGFEFTPRPAENIKHIGNVYRSVVQFERRASPL
jgi:hypothetical protein